MRPSLAALAAIICILVPGLTMVSLHSAFAGFAIGLGVWLISQPLPRRAGATR